MKKLFSYVMQGLLILLFAAMLAVVTLEWLVGCGEYYIDARGNLIQNECVFLDFPKGK